MASKGHAKTIPLAMMAIIPHTMRRSAFSLNTTQANNAVSTAWRLSIKEAVAPDILVNPNISAVGPSTERDGA